MNQPPDDLIDRWGDLQIPWTAKAKMIAAWGTAHSPVNNNDYAFIYAKVARHVAAADVAMQQGMHSRARDELTQAMMAIAAFETTSITVTTHDD